MSRDKALLNVLKKYIVKLVPAPGNIELRIQSFERLVVSTQPLSDSVGVFFAQRWARVQD